MPAINYAKVATEEGGSARRESDGPFATPPMMNRPVVWGVVCIVVLGLGYMLTGSPPTAPGANLVATLTPTARTPVFLRRRTREGAEVLDVLPKRESRRRGKRRDKRAHELWASLCVIISVCPRAHRRLCGRRPLRRCAARR